MSLRTYRIYLILMVLSAWGSGLLSGILYEKYEWKFSWSTITVSQETTVSRGLSDNSTIIRSN